MSIPQPFLDMAISGKVALVTGAAGGIGREIAQVLGACGATVAVVDTTSDQLCRISAELTGMGLDVRPFVADVSEEVGVHELVDKVESQCGPIDLLVNAAGVLVSGEVRSTSAEDWARTLAVNATGVFLVCRAVVGRMIPRRRGAIVTIASNAAGTPRAEMSAYAASKA